MVNTGSYRKTYQTCFNKKCCKKAEYRAPKSRSNLNDYHWFCLEHIREYNKSWNYYEGMSENEIEIEIRSSTTWERPTWPINGNSNINFDNLNLDFDASISCNTKQQKFDKVAFFRVNLQSRKGWFGGYATYDQWMENRFFAKKGQIDTSNNMEEHCDCHKMKYGALLGLPNPKLKIINQN